MTNELHERAVEYYSEMCSAYETYGAGTSGWHHGLWTNGDETQAEALLASNMWLVEGLELDKSSRILDLGCGMGGFTIWAARRFGCAVVGLTIVEPHADAARERAANAGVGDRCTFLCMNMDEIELDDGSFDLVINQETLVHSTDGAKCLQRVRRLLRPGGAWRAVELTTAPSLSDAQMASSRLVSESWAMAPLVPVSALLTWARNAGLLDVEAHDLTERTLPGARRMNAYCEQQLADLDRDRPVLEQFAPGRVRQLENHLRGGLGFSSGLCDGTFSLTGVRSRAPHH